MKSLKEAFASCAVGATVLVVSGHAGAATIAASNCSYSAVSAAISTAAPGDTVTVPGGACTWTSTLSINKGISLIGAGLGNTIITKASSAPSIISYSPSDKAANRLIRISGFTFDMANGTGAALEFSSGNTTVPQTKLRVDNNRFQNMALGSTQHQFIRHSGLMYGVVDNNQFGPSTYPVRTVFFPGKPAWDNYDGVTFGKADNNLFFEDNVFESVQWGITDCDNGNRYAYRYNTITITEAVYPLFDMHGNQSGGYYGCMGGELYGNKINGNYGGTFLDHRGGRAFVFNNSTAVSMGIQVREEFADSLDPVNYVGPNGPQYSLQVNGTYYWGNRAGSTGSLMRPSINTTCAWCYQNGLVAGKNFFADGTSPGITSGLPQNRPASCTLGQGYWATSQSTSDLSGMVGARPATPIAGTLYRCTANGTWDGGASPLPYPHPLRGAQPGVTLVPPTLLTVQ
jgi:hypothetical protein